MGFITGVLYISKQWECTTGLLFISKHWICTSRDTVSISKQWICTGGILHLLVSNEYELQGYCILVNIEYVQAGILYLLVSNEYVQAGILYLLVSNEYVLQGCWWCCVWSTWEGPTRVQGYCGARQGNFKYFYIKSFKIWEIELTEIYYKQLRFAILRCQKLKISVWFHVRGKIWYFKNMIFKIIEIWFLINFFPCVFLINCNF